MPNTRGLRLIFINVRKRHKTGASLKKRRCAASVCTLYAAFILVQFFKKTPVNRHSALDAESSGFKFIPQSYKNMTKAVNAPVARGIHLIFINLRKRHKPGASREKRRCAPSVCRVYDTFTRHRHVTRQYRCVIQRPARAALLLRV